MAIIQTNTGWRLPTTASNDNFTGVSTWTNPSNATAKDGVLSDNLTTSTFDTNYLLAVGFGFSLPANATPLGYEVRYRRSVSGTSNVTDTAVHVIRAANVSNAKTHPDDWSDNDVLREDTLGDSADLWGAVFTVSDINSPDFGARVNASTSTVLGANLHIDSVEMRIFYEYDDGVFDEVCLAPSVVVASNSVDDPNNVLVDDANTTELDNNSDFITVNGFNSGALQGSEITRVRIGIRAHSDNGAGSSPSATLSYLVNAVAGATSSSFEVTNNNTNLVDYPVGLLDITGDRAWTFADIDALDIRLDRDSPNNLFRDIDASHIFVCVTTQDPPQIGGINEIHRYTIGTEALNIIPAGDIGAISIGIKAHPDNTDLLLISHTNSPFINDDTGTIEPNGKADPTHLSSSILNPQELWVKSQSPNQQVEVTIYRDEAVTLSQDLNIIQTQAVGLLQQILAVLGL